MNKFRHLFTILFSLLTLHSSLARPASVHLTSEQGLPHQQVEALAQDHKGNIWIGTRNGLARYDGYEMHCYFHSDDDSTSLSNNFIKVLHVDRRGRLWVCTENGVSRYRPESDDFRNYHQGTEHVLSMVEMSNGKLIGGGDNLTVYDEQRDVFVTYPSLEVGFIVSLAVSPDNRLIVASNTAIYSYNSTLTKIRRLDAAIYEDFTTGIDGIIPMRFDHAGRLWIGRNGKGVMWVDLTTGETRIYGADKLTNGIVRAITEDVDHNIWLGTEKGITVLHSDGSTDRVQHRFDTSTLISDNAVYCILNDRYGNLWIGSYFGGVDILLRNSRQFVWTEPGNGAGQLPGKVVRQMTETPDGSLWVATEDAGLVVSGDQGRHFSPVTLASEMGTNVHSVFYHPQSEALWVGTFRRGLFRYDLPSRQWHRYLLNKGLNSDAIFDFACDADGRLWVATTQGLRRYDPDTDTFMSTGDSQLDILFVYCLCAMPDGSLWAGTTTQGLFRLNTRTGKTSHWSRTEHGLPDNYVTSLCMDSRGTLWIGTNNSGLLYAQKPYTDFQVFDADKQLQRATICSVSEDASHNIWIATSRGLYLYHPAEHTLKRFTTEDGLPTNQFNFSSCMLTGDSIMLFGTVNGLVRASLGRAGIKSERPAQRVHLTELLINNVPVLVSSPESPLTKLLDDSDFISLSYEQARSLTIVYGVIEPAQNSSVEYQVWLEGMDSGWRSVGSDRRFTGYNLRPGTYKLHVRATNNSWSDRRDRVLTIEVRPPFYQTHWAFLVYILLIAAAAWLTWRIANERMRARGEVRLAKLEKAKIEEMDRAKLDFFTTVSHELKTPLSLIVAPLRSIAHEDLSPQSQEHLSMALKNTAKMESLISELVTFNKVETAQFPFYVQQGNPLEFIARIAQSFIEPAAGRGIALSVKTEDNGEEVWFSPNYVELVLNNLLSNALKFTPAGGSVRVTASITAQEPVGTCLQLTVSDTGIGISREEQSNIFSRYYQTKRGQNVNHSGWGIGLALVKRLVEIHKGSIEVMSEEGVGSTFVCRFAVSREAFEPGELLTEDKVIVPLSAYVTPAASSESLSSCETSPSSTPISTTQYTLLFVEDNPDMLNYLRSYFAKDYQVLTAGDGTEALQLVSSEPVDLVVSDVMMPGMDGISLCQRLKGSVETSHIPVILLTAKSDTDDMVAGYRSGAEAYVTKPFTPEVLHLQISNMIQLLKSRQVEVRHARDAHDIEATSLSELDKKFIRQISELVEGNIGNSDFSVADITREMLVSRTLLHTKMKSLMGMSTGDFIRQKRLERACELLRNGSNVSETAYATGFSDPNYFSRTFKKHIGVNPSEFK